MPPGGARSAAAAASDKPAIPGRSLASRLQEATAAERLDLAVVADAFQSPIEARLENAIRESTNFVPEWSLVADLRGRIIGHTMVSYVALVDEHTTHRIPSLSPMSVATDFQRRGVGSALIRLSVSCPSMAGISMSR